MIWHIIFEVKAPSSFTIIDYYILHKLLFEHSGDFNTLLQFAKDALAKTSQEQIGTIRGMYHNNNGGRITYTYTHSLLF